MELKDRIIEEAIRLFMKLGIRHVTMDDIANNLAISKRTLYEVFKDKNELISTCIQNLTIKQDTRYQQLKEETSNVLELMMKNMLDGVQALNKINPIFFSDLKKYYPIVWEEKQRNHTEKGLNHIHTQLRNGVNEGLFRKDIDIKIVAKLFHEQINMIGDDQIFPKDEYNFVDLFKNLVINFVRGISTRKGTDLIDQILEQSQKN
ncbi:MAG TPA: TetR/AcrR family transcriptional regulator [Draconibacterium sp.]|nr:TetR/AcrR family transcriptional regulator [Draconibacterium sp.]